MLVHGVGGGRAERRKLVEAALERVGLTPPDLYADRYPHEMSGGPTRWPDPVAVPSGCRFAPRCRFAVDACRERDPQLAPVAGVAGHDAACIRAEELSQRPWPEAVNHS